MANITEKIERQITAPEGKIDALSGNYLTNTWKRQREQQERDRKKEMYHSQIQVLQFLKQKSETDTLTLLEQNLTVAAFYEDMRCFSASKKYCKDNPYKSCCCGTERFILRKGKEKWILMRQSLI